MGCRAVLLLLCLVSASLGAIVFPEFSVTNTTEIPSTSTTAAPPNSTTLTPPTATPTPPTKSTTVDPTTTTPAPTTTTVAPTTPPTSTTTSSTTAAPTTVPPTTSSTAAPTTSSTAAPTTSSTTVQPTTSSTAAPVTTTTVAPPQAAGEWLVKNETANVTCVVTKMAFSINVTYVTDKNLTKTAVLTPKTINPNGTTVEGACGNTSQWISIPLNKGALRLEFGLDSAKSTLNAIVLNVTDLPSISVNASSIYNESTPLFVTPVKMSYKCSKEQSVNLTSSNNSTAIFIFSDAQLQAFRDNSAVNFSDAQDCEGADTPDMVPIAVGISLGVMILVVLVAYLIGRRRSQSRGYVSM